MLLPSRSSFLARAAAGLVSALTFFLAAHPAAAARVNCVGGMAGAYPCNRVDLMAHVPLSTMGGGSGNVVWAWVDPLTSDEYALFGMTNGLAIVKVTNPENPVYMGKLPMHAGASTSTWRDVRVYQNHAFVVSDNSGPHGMQILELTQLRTITPPVTFTETAWYGGSNLQTTHTIWINEATGFAFLAGINSGSCSSGGLHMVNVQNPTSPVFAGCVNLDGYTHEAVCVTYAGPDTAHVGKEICFNSNGDELSIVDVTTKASPVRLARRTYSGLGYVHQAYPTEDHRYLLLNDEFDESNFGHNSRTRIFDVQDLDNPNLIGYFDGTTAAIDHNLYIRGQYCYEANYRAGLRILDITNVASASLTEVAYFDVYPSSNGASFNGSWMAYPFLPSGNVLVAGIEQGLFIVRPTLCTLTISPASLPGGTQGQGYGQNLTASGGTAPYTFSLASGTLPPGITLSPSGTISGTPTAAGTFGFTVRATDSAACTGDAPYSLVIDPPACGTIVLAPGSLPSATVGQAYSQTISASGGNAPYTFAVTAGSLPPGLSLTGAGLLSGTPTTAGTSNFTITATDASACTGSQAYSLVVNGNGCPSIVISPATLPTGQVLQAYNQLLTASGGASPYTYAVTSGSLPPGLTLSLTGLISGLPTIVGSYPFQVTATDGNACEGAQSYVIDIDDGGDQQDFIVGQGLGLPNRNRVRVYTGGAIATSVDFDAYAAQRWGVNVHGGDLNGAPYDEMITGPGPGDVFGPQVRGFLRDATPMGKVNFYAYGTLKYGVNVGAGLLDGDAFDEILTGAGPGAVFGPHVRGFNVDAGTAAAMSKLSFFAYGTLKYGVNVEEGDVEDDGYAEPLTGPGPGLIFSPTIRGFDYDGVGVTGIAKINFDAFAVPQYGANVAAATVDTDHYAEIAAAPGPGAGTSFPAHYVGFDYDAASIGALPGFDVIAFASYYGARVGMGNVDTSSFRHVETFELLAGAGRDPAADSTVKAYHYDGAALQQMPNVFVPFGTATYGVNVAAGKLGY